MDNYKDLEEMYETLSRELKKANDKIDGGDITAGDMSYIDEITHSLKSIKTIMAMMDSEYSNDEYSREGYSRGNSYARRRRRDSMGRYASDSGRRGYSRDDNMISELRGLMEDAPDERTRQEFQRLISKMENM